MKQMSQQSAVRRELRPLGGLALASWYLGTPGLPTASYPCSLVGATAANEAHGTLSMDRPFSIDNEGANPEPGG